MKKYTNLVKSTAYIVFSSRVLPALALLTIQTSAMERDKNADEAARSPSGMAIDQKTDGAKKKKKKPMVIKDLGEGRSKLKMGGMTIVGNLEGQRIIPGTAYYTMDTAGKYVLEPGTPMMVVREGKIVPMTEQDKSESSSETGTSVEVKSKKDKKKGKKGKKDKKKGKGLVITFG